MYIPHNWVKIRIQQEGKEDWFKIVGGWSGGFASGDSWRVNSGVESEKTGEDEGGEYIDFIGYSGSIYRCYKANNRVSMSIAGVLQEVLNKERPSGTTVTMEDLL